jgi:drug/metabolite transporter (DMT)-like permease
MGGFANRDDARPVIWALCAAALFGASTPLSKALLSTTSPFCLAGLLYLGAGVAVLPSALRDGIAVRCWHRGNRLRLAGAVLCGGVLAPVLLLADLRFAPAASVALWLTLEAPATALLAWMFFQEHLHHRAWLALGLIGFASVLLAAPSGTAGLAAVALVGLACVCWGLDNNLTALIDGFTPAQTTVVKGLVAGTINLGLGLWIDETPPFTAAVPALVVGALSYGVSLVLYIRAAQQLGAARSQMIFATAPFWGVALARLLLAEPMSLQQLVAGLLMLAGLWLMHTERHAHEHAHAPATHAHRHRHDDGVHEHVHPGLSASEWHSHEHTHTAVTHTHEHRPDLHHRHPH